jgi:hypothetical protein
MKPWRGAIIAVTLFLSVGRGSLATGLPHLQIPELVSQSDVVVVADVSKLTKIGSASILFHGDALPGERYSVEAVTLYTLRGSCPGRFNLEFEIPFSGVGYLSVKSGTRMLFLKKSGSIFVPADPYYPDLPAVPAAPPELQGKDTAAQVVAELGAVIASADATPEQKVEILGRSYAIPEDDETFLGDLLVGARNTADPDVKSRIQSILLRRNDISELPNMCDTLLMGNLTASQKEMLLYGIGYNLKSQKSLSQLRRLLESPDPEIRLAAAKGLWHTASPTSVPVLMKALNDENPEVRYFAIRGLADATGQPRFGPSPAAYEGHEAEYQQHWLDWAKQNSANHPNE